MRRQTQSVKKKRKWVIEGDQFSEPQTYGKREDKSSFCPSKKSPIKSTRNNEPVKSIPDRGLTAIESEQPNFTLLEN